jgi:hypothetical protein
MRIPAKSLSILILLFSLVSAGYSDSTERQSQEDDIREAVIRWQIDRFGSTDLAPENPKVYFLGVGEKISDPSEAFIKRFIGNKPPVRKISACDMSPRGDFDRITRERGYLLKVGGGR